MPFVRRHVQSKCSDQKPSNFGISPTQAEGGYQFGYDWTFPGGQGAFQRESGDREGRKQGSYGLKGLDGLVRIVSYIADEGGFRVSVSTNEPGTIPSSPADASYQTPQGSYTPTPYTAPKAEVPTYQPAKYQSQALPTPAKVVTAVPVVATAPRAVVPATLHYHHYPSTPVIYSHPTGVIPVQGRVVYGY
ncbi:hypothetical protein HPB48_017240 [Haemaphysalis longicornis]|uniref:Cuticular protein n=1 Tax=Haemaphysalis longicornis TaxID=44386 RepID=A0A9J6H2W6_HAELO|nr:hypothetical protein HPB48_017240 [Haemaphysalis longicornis]